MNTKALAEVTIRDLTPDDRDSVIRIDALHSGEPVPEYEREVFKRFLNPVQNNRSVGLVAEEDGRCVGYLLGEIRAFEFGSEACGWIYSVAVEPDHARKKIAARLLLEAKQRFRALGMQRIRTMVRRNDVAVLSFFRAQEFIGGSFVQLELDLMEDEDNDQEESS